MKLLVYQQEAKYLSEVGLAKILSLGDFERQAVQRQALVEGLAQQDPPEQLLPASLLARRELVLSVVGRGVDGILAVLHAALSGGLLDDTGMPCFVRGMPGRIQVKRPWHGRMFVTVAGDQLHRRVFL